MKFLQYQLLSQKLLRHFKSVKRIGEAAEEEIAAVVGAAKAKIVKEHLSQNQ